ncbi:alpha/beta hydrolase family protein [Tamaricihabitans halophyticus]|uniref:Alpha/beta hydrolase family protein n=1 Tax=Tamaricihabitans halophyticus TaxID=1262583 RepID=A0A4R2QHB6_9PSEU|nr:alpha/beta hydrolase [Tamaricihabitans halophyticus]TCP48660.1 alpha/beta hydrolase family protein [Tamaricihabitans halophyticus]
MVSLLAVAGLLAACAGDDSGDQEGAQQEVTEQQGPAGAVPEGLDEFYGQSLTWQDCEDYATSDTASMAFNVTGIECTRLTVPLDYAKPDGETITIGVLRHKADDQQRRIGSLIMNPGGPGAAGMPAAAQTASSATDSPLSKRFDFVGFDPRGVGASEPQISCLTGEERDAERAEDDEADTSPAGVRKQEEDQRAFAEKCAERTEHGEQMLANMGTRDVVKDMDVLRSALGDEQLSYVGYSYGTRIGSVYAETFPDNVRALVLDGALDPNQDPTDELVAQGEGFQQAFGQFADWCAKRQDCALGQQADQATEKFQELVQPLIERPVEVGDGRKLSFDDATTAAAQAMYSEQLWEPLNSGLNELNRNRGAALMQLADLYNERNKDGSYATTQDAFTAVRCVDDEPVTDRQELLATERKYKEVAPFLDNGQPAGGVRDACAFWPVPNTDQPSTPEVPDLPQTLVVSTTNDPATPYEAGGKLADALGGSLLTFEGNQHTVFLQGNQCVDKIGADYLIDLKVPSEGQRCS